MPIPTNLKKVCPQCDGDRYYTDPDTKITTCYSCGHTWIDRPDDLEDDPRMIPHNHN